MATPKLTKGRQKITMKRIENNEDRLITFSKRRSGIYKKASELITLCGAEVAVLVFSPAGKPFSFGHPSMECILNRFMGINPPPNGTTHPLVEAHLKLRINELAQQYNDLISRLDAEKEKGKMLKQMMNRRGRNQQTNWWDVPVDELNFQDLQQIKASMEQLHGNLCRKMSAVTLSGNPPTASNNPNVQNGPAASIPHGYSYGSTHF